MLDALLDALTDSLKMLPFLFAAYFLIEYLEHKASEKMNTTDDFLLRVDHHIDVQRLLCEKRRHVRIFRMPDTSQLGQIRRKLSCKEAGHDIGFIAVRHGQKHGRVFYFRPVQNRGRRA